MSITLQDYRDRFSEHSAVSDDDVTLCVGYANEDVGDEFLGTKTDRARLYYAAHFVESDFVSRSGAPSAAGVVSSKTADGLSVSFAVSVPTHQTFDDFSSTKYGQRYKQMIASLCGPVEASGV